ncbi:MAG: ATP synthase F1 subunit gamma [Erysipelotrichaceae bacterium]|jgi:F-type H+-transporting ATPase subunit gamma|nr:ATP synthase F1 subunit gamma [Erysipelotrichaceae bacterium]
MSNSKQLIRHRIASITTTRKITNAMELMATGKLKKQKERMLQYREYGEQVRQFAAQVLVQDIESDLLKSQEGGCVTIAFCSDIGLCGGYNVNLQKLAMEELDPEDPLFLIGKKALSFFVNNGFDLQNEMTGSDDLTFAELAKITRQALALYYEKKAGSLQILYTRFVNAITFEPVVVKLLPLEKPVSQNRLHKETIFDPDPQSVLSALLPMYLESLVYGAFLESKTSEQACRRMAMETATDNADELIETLKMDYNRARQAAITQEITEIVAGADAL